jgi:hypothetical protein
MGRKRARPPTSSLRWQPNRSSERALLIRAQNLRQNHSPPMSRKPCEGVCRCSKRGPARCQRLPFAPAFRSLRSAWRDGRAGARPRPSLSAGASRFPLGWAAGVMGGEVLKGGDTPSSSIPRIAVACINSMVSRTPHSCQAQGVPLEPREGPRTCGDLSLLTLGWESSRHHVWGGPAGKGGP